MLSRPHVLQALEAKRSAFGEFHVRTEDERAVYLKRLELLGDHSAAEVDARLGSIDSPGAHPTVERVAGRHPVLSFPESWHDHREARRWAVDVLRGVTTLGVDGSQISPNPDYTIPVGAIQIGWFENPHEPGAPYTKDILFEVLPPSELSGEVQSEGGFPDQQVNLRRFRGECRVLEERMAQLASQDKRALCFFDGSFIVSFAARMRPAMREGYVSAVRSLLLASEEYAVPLVGYVDTSHARDLVTMLSCLHGESTAPRLSDAALLSPLMAWGDRTEALACARDDGLFSPQDVEASYYQRVHLCYLKTTASNPPARVEVPAWLLESGMLEWSLDVVRAECIVGTGYPYAVETADAVAVISMQDRERFYRLFQDFLVQETGVNLRYSTKSQSKRVRR